MSSVLSYYFAVKYASILAGDTLNSVKISLSECHSEAIKEVHLSFRNVSALADMTQSEISILNPQ